MSLAYVADALRRTMLDAPPINAPWINLAVLVAWLIAMTGLAVRGFRWDARSVVHPPETLSRSTDRPSKRVQRAF